MDDSDPYDMTRIKARPDQLLPDNLFPSPSNITDEITNNGHVKSFYFQQRDLADELLDDLFCKVNEPIFKGVIDFADKSLSRQMFSNKSLRIHAATLLLDMQTSDHDTTFSAIEEHLGSNFKGLFIQRIKSNLRRKRNILELLETSNNSKELFLIIEQAETLDTSLAETVIGNLYQRLQDGHSKIIMILFCLSTKLQDLPFDAMGCFGKMTIIKRDTEVDRALIKEHLLRNPGITMKLGSSVLDMVYECYTNSDASIANLKFFLNYTLHQYCSRLCSLKDFKEVASGTSNFTKQARETHDFLCDQLYCYFEILRCGDDVTFLYDELASNDDLSQSIEVYEAIKKISSLSPESLVRRLEKVINFPTKSKCSRNNVISIAQKLKSVVENNDDYAHVVVKEFIEHARSVVNPLKSKYKAAYYTNVENILHGMLETSRKKAHFEKFYQPSDLYYEVLSKELFSCDPNLSANDLWLSVKEGFESLVRQHRDKNSKRDTFKITPTPKKRMRVSKKDKLKSDTSDDSEVSGLSKSIFLDIIATMEHQHLLKLSRRGGKGLLIKRAVWLD